MNERPTIPPISQVTARVDALEHEEMTRDFIGALAMNTMLETMLRLHDRNRFEADDFKRGDMIRRVLLATPATARVQDLPLAAPLGNVPATQLLRTIERALDDSREQEAAEQVPLLREAAE